MKSNAEHPNTHTQACTCQNCGTIWQINQTNPIKDLQQRVEPGEIMPAGQCPSCHALCHVEGNNQDKDNTMNELLLTALLSAYGALCARSDSRKPPAQPINWKLLDHAILTTTGKTYSHLIAHKWADKTDRQIEMTIENAALLFSGSRLFNCCTNEASPDWSRFDAIEIGGCRNDANEGDEETYICGGYSKEEAEFFTVYGHLIEGGVEAITDVSSFEEANKIATFFALQNGFKIYVVC